jgi:hypothetical protein
MIATGAGLSLALNNVVTNILGVWPVVLLGGKGLRVSMPFIMSIL